MQRQKLTHFIPQTRVSEATRIGVEHISFRLKRDVSDVVRLWLDKMVELDKQKQLEHKDLL